MGEETLGLPCPNCGKIIPPNGGVLFAAVFVCSPCGDRANRLAHKLKKDIQRMLTLSQEAIRVSLIEGKLHYGEGLPEEISKKELLETMVLVQDLVDKEKKR